MSHPPDTVVLDPGRQVVLEEDDFGAPGLIAVESIGPFAEITACGPLITVHDSIIRAGMGIPHHPHRYNERLFYLERGTFDHDDALNRISGHVPEGSLARFTEGRRGMLHEEWNHGEEDAEIYILVATTSPVPAQTSFEVERPEDMPTYQEGPGVVTRQMVGPQAPIPVHSDVRTFTDTTLEGGSRLSWIVPEGEGGILSVREGEVSLDGERLGRKWTVVLPPREEPRRLEIEASEPGRIIRATFGPGHGFITTGRSSP